MYVAGPMEWNRAAGQNLSDSSRRALQAATAGGNDYGCDQPSSPAGGGNCGSRARRSLIPATARSSCLPRNLAAKHRCHRDEGGEHHIEADPRAALDVQGSDQWSVPCHATAVLEWWRRPLNYEPRPENDLFDSNAWIRRLLFTNRSSAKQVDTALNKR